MVEGYLLCPEDELVFRRRDVVFEGWEKVFVFSLRDVVG
jgi:hypothetical protein